MTHAAANMQTSDRHWCERPRSYLIEQLGAPLLRGFFFRGEATKRRPCGGGGVVGSRRLGPKLNYFNKVWRRDPNPRCRVCCGRRRADSSLASRRPLGPAHLARDRRTKFGSGGGASEPRTVGFLGANPALGCHAHPTAATAIASTAADMTPVASHPTIRTTGPMVNLPMIRLLLLTTIMSVITGTATTPFKTALQ
jgi:hypothetical protein